MPLPTNATIEVLLDQQTSMEERRALIDRIAGSMHFRRSARLRDFLLYVGTESLKEGRRDVHEQEIGARVFDRSSGYDCSQDNIVRVNATELRKRIDLYFATEGAAEPIILTIPRGGYMPVFQRRQSESVPDPAPSAELSVILPAESTEAVTPQLGKDGLRAAFAALLPLAVSLALAAACVMLFQQNRAMHKLLNRWDGEPAVASLWGNFIGPSHHTDVVLPDASLSIREELTGLPISLSDYINRHYMNEADSLPVSKDRREDLRDIYGHNLVAFGDFRAAQQILGLNPAGSSLHLTLSRFFQAESVKHDNLILIGGKKANPWIYLFDEQMNFSLEYDVARGSGHIVNRRPRGGEPDSYASSQYPNGLVGYSIVAYLQNPSHDGSAMIIAGTDSDATSAAAEFLTSEEQLSKFRKMIGADQFPYFEILLKTSRLSGTSLSSEILAFRTYPIGR